MKVGSENSSSKLLRSESSTLENYKTILREIYEEKKIFRKYKSKFNLIPVVLDAGLSEVFPVGQISYNIIFLSILYSLCTLTYLFSSGFGPGFFLPNTDPDYVPRIKGDL